MIGNPWYWFIDYSDFTEVNMDVIFPLLRWHRGCPLKTQLQIQRSPFGDPPKYSNGLSNHTWSVGGFVGCPSHLEVSEVMGVPVLIHFLCGIFMDFPWNKPTIFGDPPFMEGNSRNGRLVLEGHMSLIARSGPRGLALRHVSVSHLLSIMLWWWL